jgi:hypothetical protein
MQNWIATRLPGKQAAEIVIFLAILGLGLFLRFTDLTDPPLDFHPMRQLRGATLARSIYYQMLPNADPDLVQKAMAATRTISTQEPRILEHLVATTYLLVGGEHLWIARVYSILFWSIAGLVFFSLARRMVSTSGALVSLAYIMLLPFSVAVSRSFQPDPFMVMWIALTVLAATRWGEKRSWKWAVVTGLLAGWTMLVKITAVYYLSPTLLMLVLTNWKPRQWIRDLGVWLAAALAILFPAGYYLLSIGGQSSGWFADWALGFTNQLVDPAFYIQWLKYIDYLFEMPLVWLALAGTLLISRTKDRLLLSGLWAGYLLFGISFPYPIRTHEYYSIMLIPVIGLSLAPIGRLFFSALASQPRFWRWLVVPVVLLAVSYPSWLVYTGMIGTDYRQESAGWEKISAALPEGNIVGLTHDYGMRMAYFGWRPVRTWPTTSDFALLAQSNVGYSEDFKSLFVTETAEMDYFLVTLLGELESQPMLKARLYENYPLLQDGEGYLLFDLRHPFSP